MENTLKNAQVGIQRIQNGKPKKILKLIKRNDLNPTHITEVGCGVGEILSSLHQNMSADCIFNGYDISQQAIKKSKTHRKQKINVS